MQYIIDRRRELRAGPLAAAFWPYALLVQSDADAAAWRVTVTEGGQPVDLTGWSIAAQVQRPGGATVLMTGSAQGATASVTLPGVCFEEGGELTCRMTAARDGACVTIDLLRIPVQPFGVDQVLDPEGSVPSLPELLEQVGRLEEATAAADAAVAAAQELTDTPAYIGENGHWYVFDKETQAYADSGVPAQGEQGPKGEKGDPGEVANLSYSSSAPMALGEASPGTEETIARGDHVHPLPTAADVGATPAGTAIPKVGGATQGDIPTFNASGALSDSGVKMSSFTRAKMTLSGTTLTITTVS